MFDHGTLPFSAVIHTRLRLMSSLIQIASESIGDPVKERRHPDTLLFVDEHSPVSEMWTDIGKLLFFHFLLSELYLAKGLLYFSIFFGHEIIRSLFNRLCEWCCVGYFVDARD